MENVIIPQVNLNGTSRRSLLEEYDNARRAVEDAKEKIPEPHPRDYPNGGYLEAAAQQREMRGKLFEVMQALEEICESLA